MAEEAIMSEYEYYRSQVDAYKKNIELINASIAELTIVSESLDNIKNLDSKNEVLLPLGAESFITARVTDVSKVIIGIGAGVAVKKSIGDAKRDLKTRIAELEKVRKEHTDGLGAMLSRMDEIAPQVRKFIEEKQREG